MAVLWVGTGLIIPALLSAVTEVWQKSNICKVNLACLSDALRKCTTMMPSCLCHAQCQQHSWDCFCGSAHVLNIHTDRCTYVIFQESWSICPCWGRLIELLHSNRLRPSKKEKGRKGGQRIKTVFHGQTGMGLVLLSKSSCVLPLNWPWQPCRKQSCFRRLSCPHYSRGCPQDCFTGMCWCQ